MNLPDDLVSKFVEVTKKEKTTKDETTVYGTTVEYNGDIYVKIDGSEQLTPVYTTSSLKPDQRVSVLIKNRTATVTGNITSPSIGTLDVKDLNDKISEFEIVVANKVSTEELEVERARINTLKAENATITETLTAAEADIDDLKASNVTITEKLTANEADIESLKTTKLDASIADIKYATVGDLNAANANITNLSGTFSEFQVSTTNQLSANEADIKDLQADKLDATSAEIMYANIDFANINEAAVEKIFTESGIIKDLTVSGGKITGELVGVTIKGDLIEGNTVKADKLVVKGSDGIFYKLNIEGGATTSEQVTEDDLKNGLSGSIIVAKSVTAEKIAVDDLVAFGATIGGFKITNSSIYSGVKSSVDNTTRGAYLDNTGQIAFGDSNNYLKYYKDQNGNYKLDISATSFSLSSGTDIETAISNLRTDVSTAQQTADSANASISDLNVGGRNLLIGAKDLSGFYANRTTTTFVNGEDGYTYADFPVVTSLDYRAISSSYAMINIEDIIGKEVTLSFEVRSDEEWTATNTEITVTFSLCNDSSTNRLKLRSTYIKETIGTAWKKFEITCVLNESYFTSGSGSIEDCTRFYVQIYNYSLNHLQVRKPKLEYGNVSTDWSIAEEDVETDIQEAAKVAKSFMDFDSTNGLQIGNKTGGSWSGFRTQITGAAFNILNSAGSVLASYGEKLIELGKNATDAVIKLCGGKGRIEYITDEDSNAFLQVYADKLRLMSSQMSSLYSMYTDESTKWEKSAVNVSTKKVNMYASECIDPTMVEKVEGWNTSELTINPGGIEATTPGNVTIDPDGVTKVRSNVYISSIEKTAHNDGVTGWYFGTDGSAHATNSSKGGLIGFHYAGSQEYTSLIGETSSGVITINGMDYGVNQVLWSGAYYMNASQTITLNKAISKQTSGIILVFSYYDSGAAQDHSFNTHFVSKKQVELFPNCGHTFMMGINAGFSSIGAKYLYFTDTTISGHSGNTTSGTNSGITFDNSKYVLRYVIGV